MAHHTLRLHSSPYAQPGDVEVHGFIPQREPEDAAIWAGRCALTFRTGGSDLNLRLQVADLRRLALVCTALADELENAPSPHNGSHHGPQHQATADVMRLVGAA